MSFCWRSSHPSRCLSGEDRKGDSGDSADSKAEPGNTSAANPKQPSDSKADPNLEAKKKEERAKADKEKERLRLEQEAKQAEEAIRNTTVLQAPPFGKGTPLFVAVGGDAF